MLIIGCDYHPGFQQIAFVDTETGELGERRLMHRQEGEQFYRKLQEQSLKVVVGMEASGHSRWFERLLREMQFEDAFPRAHAGPQLIHIEGLGEVIVRSRFEARNHVVLLILDRE